MATAAAAISTAHSSPSRRPPFPQSPQPSKLPPQDHHASASSDGNQRASATPPEQRTFFSMAAANASIHHATTISIEPRAERHCSATIFHHRDAIFISSAKLLHNASAMAATESEPEHRHLHLLRVSDHREEALTTSAVRLRARPPRTATPLHHLFCSTIFARTSATTAPATIAPTGEATTPSQ
ncbi:hypothetical protein DEO72_LG5g1294 [Vigna unguiculata]|uniref:Uncharacterized protein n=1 Tax=Vigna unguiculata TaxID=3917 RepID=A0A4D6LWH0_VIGUN|nr:hypothetical protein DEO72_LG5g1294 [Vigna unguiculata]